MKLKKRLNSVSERLARLNHRKKRILKHLSKIKVRIHRITLFGPYNWPDIDRNIGRLFIIDNSYNSQKPAYKTHAVAQLPEAKLSVHLNPIDPNYPWCQIETSYPSKLLLTELGEKLPMLQVSKVEYAIDLFFGEEFLKYITRDFILLRRYLYFPHQKICETYSQTRKLSDESRTKNAGMAISNIRSRIINGERKNLRRITRKLYERGLDKKKVKGKYWKVEERDRIRLEITAYGEDLGKKGIKELGDFAENPKFDEALKNKFRFCKFRSKSPNIKNESDKYNTPDSREMKGAFQTEFLAAKEAVGNVHQYLVGVQELRPLYRSMKKAIIKAEKKWLSPDI